MLPKRERCWRSSGNETWPWAMVAGELRSAPHSHRFGKPLRVALPLSVEKLKISSAQRRYYEVNCGSEMFDTNKIAKRWAIIIHTNYNCINRQQCKWYFLNSKTMYISKERNTSVLEQLRFTLPTQRNFTGSALSTPTPTNKELEKPHPPRISKPPLRVIDCINPL